MKASIVGLSANITSDNIWAVNSVLIRIMNGRGDGFGNLRYVFSCFVLFGMNVYPRSTCCLKWLECSKVSEKVIKVQ